MSILDKDKIDIVAVGVDNVELVIVDFLEWSGEWDGEFGDGVHALLLQDKINLYISAVESGELVANEPKTDGKDFMIKVVSMYMPNENAKKFLTQAKIVISSIDIDFKFEWAMKDAMFLDDEKIKNAMNEAKVDAIQTNKELERAKNSLLDKHKIDTIYVGETTLELGIIDLLPWEKKSDEKHASLIREKLNLYIGVVTSDEIYELRPDAKGKSVVFKIISKHNLNKFGEQFVKSVGEFLNKFHVELVFEWHIRDEWKRDA